MHSLTGPITDVSPENDGLALYFSPKLRCLVTGSAFVLLHDLMGNVGVDHAVDLRGTRVRVSFEDGEIIGLEWVVQGLVINEFYQNDGLVLVIDEGAEGEPREYFVVGVGRDAMDDMGIEDLILLRDQTVRLLGYSTREKGFKTLEILSE